MSDPAAAVARLCRVRAGDPSDEAPFVLDPDGFLAPLYEFSWMSDGSSDGALVTAEVAAQSGAFVLLGEPGVGKTTVLRALTQELVPVDDVVEGEPGLLWVDGAELTDGTADELLCRYLERLPPAPSSGPRILERSSVLQPAQLTIVLDQLDESGLLRHLAGRIRRSVRGRDTSALHWLVACRAVDYYSPLTRQLEADGRSAVVADLAPLSREQAMRLADEFGVDGEALISAAVGIGAGALASIPLTLQLLVKLSRSPDALAGTAADLFHRSVRQLLVDPDQDRAGISAEIDQLFAVAARIAARAVLSNCRVIWTGRELAREAGRSGMEVSAGTLPGGQEQTINGPFEVTADLVRATLATAVFSPRGADRLAFSHSSISAYLAAWYLSARNVPERQLKPLFLVVADDGSTSIPSPVRETAAWLVTLQPSCIAWLTDADPRSLASYSSLVDNPETRRALVTAMLHRADDLELSDLPWQLDRTRLSYRGLAAQLAQKLTDAASAPESWPERARARLAIRLAHQAEPASELIEALLDVVESPLWDAHERRLAVGALEDIDLAAVGARLRRVLDTELVDPARRAAVDPDDELRGALLFALWPTHLALTEALEYIGPRSNPHMVGIYAAFVRALSGRVEDDDLPELLHWAARSADNTIGPQTSAWTGGDGVTQATIRRSWHTNEDLWGLAEEMIEPLLERATSWKYGDRFMNHAAKIIWLVVHADGTAPVPGPLDTLDADGLEPLAAQRARHALCLALCRQGSTSDMAAHTAARIVHGWTHRFRIDPRHPDESNGYQYAKRSSLVDNADFVWALSEAAKAVATGDQDLASVLAHVASSIMDPDDRNAYELAFTYENTPLWEALRGHFDPIPLDSDLASMLRRSHERTRTRPEPVFEEAEEFHAKIRSDRDRAGEGDTTAFWHLLWNLQFDPQTGRGHPPSSVDDPRALPAASHLEPSLSDLLPSTALNFITSTDDRRTEWLGTTRYDKRAWAGYLAIALLERLGRTAELTDDVWQAWVGALLWFTPNSEPTDGHTRRRRLLAAASAHAFHDLNNAIPTYVLGEIARGSEPNDLNLDDFGFVSRHQSALHYIVEAIVAAMRSGDDAATPAMDASGLTHQRTMLPTLQLAQGSNHRHAASRTLASTTRALMSVGHQATIDAAMAAIEHPTESGTADYEVIYADSLLRTKATELSAVLDVLQVNSQLGVQLANYVGSRSSSINQRLDEVELTQLLRWLVTLPRQPSDPRQRPWVVRDVSGVDEWRRQALRDLANRQSITALDQLNTLRSEFPSQLDIAAAVVTARTAVHASLWTAPDPDEVGILLIDAERYLIRSNEQLAGLLTDTLEHISQDLPTHGELLWDRQRRRPLTDSPSKPARRRRQDDTWRPKPEAALCAYLAHELKIRLHGQGVAVNREVLIKPTDPYGAGHRTDILVEAFPRRNPRSNSIHDPKTRLAVVIEVKGQWNPGLEDDLTGQLAERYLVDAQTDTGVYLVGWFPIDQWNDTSDRRHREAKKRDPSQTYTLLQERASDIDGKRVIVQIMQVPRPQQQK